MELKKQKFPIWKSRLSSSYTKTPVTVCAQSGRRLRGHMRVVEHATVELLSQCSGRSNATPRWDAVSSGRRRESCCGRRVAGAHPTSHNPQDLGKGYWWFTIKDQPLWRPTSTVLQKSDAKIQITITTAYIIRITYPLSGCNYHLSDINVANFNKIHRTVFSIPLLEKLSVTLTFDLLTSEINQFVFAPSCTWIVDLVKFSRSFLANVNSCSYSLYGVVRPSVCNVRAPYSADWNFRQCFCAMLA